MNLAMELFEREGLPPPVTEYRFHPTRRWRFDYAWPSEKIAVEVEGGIWSGGRHTSARGFFNDMEKYNTAACMGWRVLRVTPKAIATLVTVQMVREAIASGRIACFTPRGRKPINPMNQTVMSVEASPEQQAQSGALGLATDSANKSMDTNTNKPSGDQLAAVDVGSGPLLGDGWSECGCCGMCDGTGEIDGYEDDPNWYHPGEMKPCPQCGGTGR